MDANLAAVVALIFFALVFDYINGFHDAAELRDALRLGRLLLAGHEVSL